MARLIKISGEEIELFPTHGENFTAEELEGYLGGVIGMFGFHVRGMSGWVIYNQAGEVLRAEDTDLPYNSRATAIINFSEDDIDIKLFGDIMFTNRDEWNDELYHQYLASLEDEEPFEDDNEY